MKISGIFWLLFFVQLSMRGFAADNASFCPVCHNFHFYDDQLPSDVNVIDFGDFPSIKMASSVFPCLATQIDELVRLDFLPDMSEVSASIKRVSPGQYSLSMDHLLRLIYLSSIRADNYKLPMTTKDNRLFYVKIPQDKLNEKVLVVVACTLFIIFSAGSALSTFFSMIYIYSNPTNATNSSQPIPNTYTSLLLQNSLIAFVSFICTVLSSLTNFSWTEFHKVIIGDYINNFMIRAKAIDDEFIDLSYALLILNIYHPKLAVVIANDMNDTELVNRLWSCLPSEQSGNMKGAVKFLSVVDYIKSNGTNWPSDYKLQDFILSIERNLFKIPSPHTDRALLTL